MNMKSKYKKGCNITFLGHRLIIKKVTETPFGFYYELGCLCCTTPYYLELTISESELKAHQGVDLEVIDKYGK